VSKPSMFLRCRVVLVSYTLFHVLLSATAVLSLHHGPNQLAVIISVFAADVLLLFLLVVSATSIMFLVQLNTFC
jgi:hypothetical protein